jgi:hypothetical protein
MAARCPTCGSEDPRQWNGVSMGVGFIFDWNADEKHCPDPFHESVSTPPPEDEETRLCEICEAPATTMESGPSDGNKEHWYCLAHAIDLEADALLAIELNRALTQLRKAESRVQRAEERVEVQQAEIDSLKGERDALRLTLECLVGIDRRLMAARRLPQPFSARDYALLTEQTDQHANNDLSWLVRMHLARRERDDPPKGGKRYRYWLNRSALTPSNDTKGESND